MGPWKWVGAEASGVRDGPRRRECGHQIVLVMVLELLSAIMRWYYLLFTGRKKTQVQGPRLRSQPISARSNPRMRCHSFIHSSLLSSAIKAA